MSVKNFKTVWCFLKSTPNIFCMNSYPKIYSAKCFTLSICSGFISSCIHFDLASIWPRFSLLPGFTTIGSSSAIPPSLLGTNILCAKVPRAVAGRSVLFKAATAKVFLYGDFATSKILLKGASGFNVGPVAVIGRLVGYAGCADFYCG